MDFANTTMLRNVLTRNVRQWMPRMKTTAAATKVHGAPLPAFQQLGNIRSLFIQTQETPNPHSLKFMPGETVLDERFTTGIDFTPQSKEVQQSPLAQQLFQIPGITRVFFANDYISITKQENAPWDSLRSDIFQTIMEYFAKGEPIMSDEPIVTDTTILPDDDEVVAMIKELLEARIRPAVQEDGGDVFYRGFDAERGIVKLQLAGSCAGCPSSGVTLSDGVENMLKYYIPEVKGIEQIEDEELKEINAKEVDSLEEKLRKARVLSD